MSRYCVNCTWEEVPHLSRELKDEFIKSVPPHLRDARSKGIPQLGAGAIYPVRVEDISVDNFVIPKSWRRAYALDVGWNATAAIFGAWEAQTDTVYLWDAYKRGQAEPVVHAEAVKRRGAWIPGVCDPAAAGRNQDDGQRILDIYRGLGLNLQLADHTVDAGTYEVWNRLATGRLKVFKSLSQWFAEFTLYHRNEKGQIVKENDHLMDATRYLLMSGGARACVEPTVQAKTAEQPLEYVMPDVGGLAWMGH